MRHAAILAVLLALLSCASADGITIGDWEGELLCIGNRVAHVTKESGEFRIFEPGNACLVRFDLRCPKDVTVQDCRVHGGHQEITVEATEEGLMLGWELWAPCD